MCHPGWSQTGYVVEENLDLRVFLSAPKCWRVKAGTTQLRFLFLRHILSQQHTRTRTDSGHVHYLRNSGRKACLTQRDGGRQSRPFPPICLYPLDSPRTIQHFASFTSLSCVCAHGCVCVYTHACVCNCALESIAFIKWKPCHGWVRP